VEVVSACPADAGAHGFPFSTSPTHASTPLHRCPAPERWCPELSQCSVRGLCNALLASLESSAIKSAAITSAGGAAEAAASFYVPPLDKTPPKLRLLGNGTAALTPSGAALMLDNVTWNAEWVDPGATAMDAIDGDVTGRIQRLGVGECGRLPRLACV
jgi:hypothetical protein